MEKVNMYGLLANAALGKPIPLAGNYGSGCYCPVTRLLLRRNDVLFIPTAPHKQ